jgi:flagellin-like hook-associated protein FlgL
MRGRLAWIVAIVAGVLVVLAVTAMVGNRDKSGETVPAGEWAQSVCGAVGTWRGEMKAIVEDIRTPSASGTTGGEEPQSETPQGRTGFVRKGLERGVQATETMVTGIDNAGVPDTPQGDAAAKQVSGWADSSLNDLEAAQDSLETEAETLEEAVKQVTGAAGTIGSVLTGGVQTFTDVARLDPELAAALKSSSTCQELRKKEQSS